MMGIECTEIGVAGTMLVYIGFWRRLAAHLVDLAILHRMRVMSAAQS